MKSAAITSACALSAVAMGALAVTATPQRVNVDNFKRAETDNYFSKFVAEAGGLAKSSMPESRRRSTSRQLSE